MQTLTTTVYLSKKGRKKFKKSINKLERTRSKIIHELHDQDKINNHEARFEKLERLSRLDAIENEIEEKMEVLRVAKPFPRESKSNIKKVVMGSEVELIDPQGDRMIYTIVDTIEADPSLGHVSSQSPLGRVLMGKKPFDTIEWPGTGGSRMQLMRISQQH